MVEIIFVFIMRNLVLSMLILLTSGPAVMGQSAPGELSTYQIKIKKAGAPIKLDGVLSEQAWLEADVGSDFWLQYPKDNIKASSRTEVRVTYDSDNVYIAAICYDVQEYVVQTLKRDKSFFEGDGFGVIIDPVNKSTNGFLFGISPFNVQSEELLGPKAPDPENLTFSWDNRWFSAVTRFPDRYIVEIAIPFKTLRFKKGITTWGINFIRNDLSRNQNYSWTPIPVNFHFYDLWYTGSVIWDKAPKKTGTNISVLPYVTARALKDGESEASGNMGVDAKVALTSSLNLDLTINPDFSQVDVDVQQTNLTRFNLRFPEQRGFFLENNDLFTGFGPNNAKPIFTRRIGLDEQNRAVPIVYGTRLSGNLNPKFRIGLLNMRTKATDSGAGQNYTVAAFNHSLWSRSVLRGYATNRQAHSKMEGLDKNDYGRNAGMELYYLNESGTWNYFVSFHISGKPEIGLGTYSNLGLEYAGRKWRFRVNYYNVDSKYHADIGFIPQMGIYDALRDTIIHMGYEHIHGRIGYTIRPKVSSKIIAHNIEVRNTTNWYPDGNLSDKENRIDYEIRFRNTSRMTFQAQDLETRLLFATGFTDEEPLIPGTYRYSRFTLAYNTDARKTFPIKSEVATGQFYNGYLTKYLLELNFRKQPWGTFSLAWEQNNLKLPFPYGKSNLTLINARSEVNFSTKVFWTTFLQYNTQRDNFNINSRLQYRYRTMSDIFLVYSYYYTMSPFLPNYQIQAILLKVNYMFNF